MEGHHSVVERRLFMTKRVQRKTLKQQKPKPSVDPLQEEMINRLSAVEAFLSPFWSARSGYRDSFPK